MKKYITLIVAVLFLQSHPSFSASHHQDPLGVGVILGSPSGLVAKYWLHSASAVDLGLAYAWKGFFQVYVDYLYHFLGAFSKGDSSMYPLSPYIGIGGSLTLYNPTEVAVRIPLGLEWMVGHPRIGIFAELVPGLALVPATNVIVQGGVGARIYF
jgi:hypothetical protein